MGTLEELGAPCTILTYHAHFHVSKAVLSSELGNKVNRKFSITGNLMANLNHSLDTTNNFNPGRE